MKPYTHGFRVGKSKWGVPNCPYPANSQDREDWLRGFDDGRYELGRPTEEQIEAQRQRDIAARDARRLCRREEKKQKAVRP